MSKHVYLLQSLSHPNQKYVGSTSDIENRLKEHNAGKSPHTSKYIPWEIVVSVFFKDEKRALDFEKYLKHGSGHAFAKKHFW